MRLRESTPAVTLLATLLRGDGTSLAWPATAVNQKHLLVAAHAHGITGLLARQLRNASSACPPDFATEVTRIARAEVVIEECRRREVLRVLAALQKAHVETLIIKGAGLAYTHYAHPSLRPRNDTDLHIQKKDWTQAAQVLDSLGYRRKDEIRGDVARNQGEFVREERCMRHVFDVHWQTSDRPVFAAALDFETLMQNAVEIPAVGPVARTLSSVHALLLACMHRVRHYNSDLLIWLYDIHLLAERLSGPEVDEFVAAARCSRITAICAAGLRRAAEHFHTAIPDGLLNRLTPAGMGDTPELSARYLAVPPWRARLLDLRTQSDWRQRLRFICELATSDRQYLLNRYQRANPAWLPALYARRLVWRAFNLLGSIHSS
jgi:hypothetical protein